MDLLEQYGWLTYSQHLNSYDKVTCGRIITVHKTNYRVLTSAGIMIGELMGQLLYSAEPHELPQTGDWVKIITFDDQCIIKNVLPRETVLARKTAGKTTQTQVLAANICGAIIVQALNRDFNPRRLERMVTALNDAQIRPFIVLNKKDLSDSWEEQLNQIKERLHSTDVFAISALNKDGLNTIKAFLMPQLTYVLLGTSGAGKSTLLNALSNMELQETQSLSNAVNKGKHTTTGRELFPLDNGSLLIDSPGVREFALALDDIESVNMSFEDIDDLSQHCRYSDCTHTSEPGCAILKAIEENHLNSDVYNSYIKLRNEALHYQKTADEKKRKGKSIAKLVKNMKKQNIKKRYD